MNGAPHPAALFIAESSPELLTTRMSQRNALFAIMTVLALGALGTGSACAQNRAAGDRHGANNANNQVNRVQADRQADRYQRDSYQPARNERREAQDGDLPRSVRRIQRETGGEVLKAQPIQRDGREVYRVKVLTPQGRIRVYEEAPPLRQQPVRNDWRQNQQPPPPRRYRHPR